ncbi:MAG: hypothetical protein IKZ44_03475 [Clostridia bacterium]|nr:hypothetical protein [Clostridia bacterium]
MSYPLSLVLALLTTEAIEVPVCLLWGMRRRDLIFVVLANVLTNPLLNVLYAIACLYTRIPPAAALAVLESAAVAAEWIVYRSATQTKRPFLVSLTANAVSFGLGLLITTFIF